LPFGVRWQVGSVRDFIRVARRMARPLKRGANAVTDHLARNLASRSSTRRLLNKIYNRLPSRQQEAIHSRFKALFYGDVGTRIEPGLWHNDFAGKQIISAISASQAGSDWDLALSILGHDAQVKQSYRNFIHAPRRPELFIDIGANYGTHSILFLVHGVETISFEPNVLCYRRFRELCAMNNVVPRIEAVALGASSQSIDLSFPEGEEWLGSTQSDVIEVLRKTRPLQTRNVQQRRLDDLAPALSGHRDILIKIDTEGAEADVLEGGKAVIKEFYPTIIFECLDRARPKIFTLLQSLGYRITALPLCFGTVSPALEYTAFCNDARTNFGAVPK
jgi:FkbM family methyltransferase